MSHGDKLEHINFNESNGEVTNLEAFRGQVVLIVNVASACGFTPQYAGLETLFETYQSKGFTVLAFPANEFGAQEPGTNSEIQEFCQVKFGVRFPVLEKVVVKGANQHPFFRTLIQSSPKAQKKAGSQLEENLSKHGLLTGGETEIKWNFEKFLVGRDGKVVARFQSDITPEDPELRLAIEKELEK